jgi:dCMP deaminase
MNILSEKWCVRFLHLARTVSRWSKDPSTQVGAVITSMEGDPISFGYNGFPKGVRESDERLERPQKYDFSEHAERNAIYLSRRDLRDMVMYVTCLPCCDCARAIIQSGINILVVDGEYQKTIRAGSSILTPDFKRQKENSRIMLEEAGVQIIEKFTANDITKWENING